MPVRPLFCAYLGLLLGSTSVAAADPELGPPLIALAANEEQSTLEAPIVEVPPSPRRTRWYTRGSVGVAYRWAFGESMLGASLDGELGGQSGRLAGGLRLHIEPGRLLVGLPAQVVTFGPKMWVKAIDRVRFGAGIDGGAFVISRFTMPGRSMWSVMLGGHVGGSIDIYRLGNTGALQLDTTVGAYALTTAPGPLSLVTSLALGYRP